MIRLFPFEEFEQEKAFSTTTDSNYPNPKHIADGKVIRLSDEEQRIVVAEAESSNNTVSGNDDRARRPLVDVVDDVAQGVEGGLPGASRQAGSNKKGGTRWKTAGMHQRPHWRENFIKIRKKRLGRGGLGTRGG